MKARVIGWVVLAVFVSGVRSGTPEPTAVPTVAFTQTPPPTTEGYVGTLVIDGSVPSVTGRPPSLPEAQALIGRLKDNGQLKTRIYLTRSLSRQEVLSTDFALPVGTVLLHDAGAKFYVIANPKDKTYIVMDASALLGALEGGVGIANSEYEASIQHTGAKKQIAGFACRKSVLQVKYASAIPFENDKIYVQQANDIEVWHTFDLVSSALVDHFFFKFERDKTRTVQKLVATDIGFPMEMTMAVATTDKGHTASGAMGSLHMVITELRKEKALDSELFRIPPAGYKRLERNPYFANANVVAP
jgi:hypothetical protein